MEVAIFIVRVALSVLLYAFLGALFVLLRRDLKSATRQRAVQTARERPGCLRVMQGGDGLTDDAVLALLPLTTIGRSDASTIVVGDPYASAEHAIVAWRNGQWWLEDRGSRNGTLLNDVPIDEPLVISHGDVIGIGHLQFKFEYINDELWSYPHR
jgi:hypothetical protein